MSERAIEHQYALVTWVIVVDAKRAQIYAYHKTIEKVPLEGANKHRYYDEKSGYSLTSVLNGALSAESTDDYQLGRDRRGTSSSSNSSTHNTYEPHGDITEELHKRFARTIAGKLRHAYEGKLFGHLILVAPPKMIGELREQLATDVEKSIVATVAKDLMHFHGEELVTHLRDTIIESHVQ